MRRLRRSERHEHGAEFDSRLRLCAFLFAALANGIAFVYSMLPLDQDVMNQRGLRALALGATAVLVLVMAFPWKRVARGWFVIGALIALPCIAAYVQLSGGWLSPLQSFYFLALVFHAIYFRRRVALALNMLTLLFSFTPVLFDHDATEFSKHLVVNAAVFLALGFCADAIVQEVRWQERRISALTIERRSSERETARLAALQRAGVLINSRLNAHEAMEALVGELSTTLGYPFVTIYLQEDDDHPALVASAGYREPVPHRPLAESVVDRVFRSGIATIVRDVKATATRFRTAPGVRSIVSVPVHDGRNVIGVLTVEDVHTLDTRDLELLELFAQQADAALTNARRYAQEQQRAAREEALQEVALALASTLDPATVLHGVLDQLERVLPFDGAAFLTGDEGNGMRVATTRGRFAADDPLLAGFDPYRHADATLIAREDEPHLLPAYYVHEMPDISDDRDASFPGWIGSLVVAPLLIDHALRGVILVAAERRGQYTSADADLVADFARHSAVALHNAELHDALARTARTDSLTGLLNHGALLETLALEIDRGRRYGHPLSILFFDLDHFKAINDTYGHQFGDGVLRSLARITRETVRHIDTVGRYGGEEFVAVLPETDYVQAMTVAERLRAQVASQPIGQTPDGADVRVTISVGVTAFPADGGTVDDLIRIADGALYTAKRRGRNHVCGPKDMLRAAD